MNRGGAVTATPTRSQRVLWGLVVNGAALAAWAAEASDQGRQSKLHCRARANAAGETQAKVLY
jgi:hypothetical protein